MNIKERYKIVSAAGRILVGMVFVYSGYLKIMEPFESFYSSIISYRVVNETIAYYTAVVLPWFEFYLGLLLIFGLFERYIIKAAILIFVIFEIILLQAMIRKLDIVNCGCFGSSHSNPIWVEFFLNIIWISFLVISLKFKTNFSLDIFLESKYQK